MRWVQAPMPSISAGAMPISVGGPRRVPSAAKREAPAGAAKAAWLRMWGRVFDPNLPVTLRRLGLNVEAAA